MCVTNTTNRRPLPVAFTSQQVSLSHSLLSQRLLGAYIPAITAKQPVYNRTELRLPSEFISTVPEDKPRPKRRRKPQKPGKTAKNNERHFVVHDYHDHSLDDEGDSEVVGDSDDAYHRRRGGVSIAFPMKLHSVLDQVEIDGLAHVISWQKHGRAFVIHHPKEFVDHVMPKYFRQSKLTSFQRQLNLYGFCRLTRGPDAGGYYHELFLRGKVCLCKKMTRTKVKGTKFKAASSPEQEPDFYKMPPVVVSPAHSDEESCSHEALLASDSRTPIDAKVPSCVSAISYRDSRPLHFMQQSLSEPSTTPFARLPLSDPPTIYYAQDTAGVVPVRSFSFSNRLQVPNDADKILDEAVDELFLQQEEVDNLNEFVHDWDPNCDQNVTASGTVEDDFELGYLLEKLLDG